MRVVYIFRYAGSKSPLSRLREIFEDEELVSRIKERLPYLFQFGELDASRGGKVGMEIGSIRERILIALLMYKFGEDNVETEIPITEPEVDVRLFGEPLSIKTITSTGTAGVKVIWTVDAQKAREFYQKYVPSCDILLVRIKWDGVGGLFYIPLEVQRSVFQKVGREKYLKLPKVGTNPRGVEFTSEAISMLINHQYTLSIQINWKRRQTKYNPYKRWIDYWREN